MPKNYRRLKKTNLGKKERLKNTSLFKINAEQILHSAFCLFAILALF